MTIEEIDQDAELDRIYENSGDENPYRELIVNNADKVESIPHGIVVNP